MTFTSVGDLALSMQLRRDNARLNSTLQRLASELSSGRISDIRMSLSGDFGPLASLERDQQTLEAYRISGQEAALFAGVAQTSLETIQQSIDDLMPALILTRTSSQPTQIATIGSDAAQKFEAAVSALNKDVAGRSIFAGNATDGPALVPGSTILNDLEAAVAGAGTAAAVDAIVTAWFQPGGGYDSTSYLGSATPQRPFRLSEGENAAFDMTALDGEMRDVLKGFALSALLDRGVLGGFEDERRALAIRSGDALLAARDGLVDMRARVGTVQAAVERAVTRNAAGLSANEMARAELLRADPFQTATELQSVQAQLEALYTTTARLSGLSLTNYLR